MHNIDRRLLSQAQQGEETAMAAVIARMMPVIRKGAAANTAPGLDFEDAVQEGLIGLFNAVRTCRDAQAEQFTAYAAACIRHAQMDARRTALRKKHAPLNFSVPLAAADAALPGPEERAIAEERCADVLARMNTQLSELERRALRLTMDGIAADKAAAALGITPRAVQNAVTRARRKLRGTSS